MKITKLFKCNLKEYTLKLLEKSQIAKAINFIYFNVSFNGLNNIPLKTICYLINFIIFAPTPFNFNH